MKIQLKKLKHLNLHETLFSDPGMEYLAEMTELETLHIGSVKDITDAGLEHLKHLKKLKQLNVIECFLITDEGIDNLRQMLPDLQIER